MLQPLYAQWKSPEYLLDRGLLGLRDSLDTMQKEKSLTLAWNWALILQSTMPITWPLSSLTYPIK
jgi:hypothetical protein